jgi:hypothetical protein
LWTDVRYRFVMVPRGSSMAVGVTPGSPQRPAQLTLDAYSDLFDNDLDSVAIKDVRHLEYEPC